VRLRQLERVGSAIGFSPEGRAVRVWVKGMPGADETEVVPGTLVEVRDDGGAVLSLAAPDGEGRERRLLAVPHEDGWGLQALWFSFISVDVFELEGEEGELEGEERELESQEPLGLWFIRLGAG
jgi:hypothetical protein